MSVTDLRYCLKCHIVYHFDPDNKPDWEEEICPKCEEFLQPVEEKEENHETTKS